MGEAGFLAEPFEILELTDGQSASLMVTAFQLGQMRIHPRYPGAPKEKVIQALRLQLAPGVKAAGPPYWDVTSQTLIAQLKPLLPSLIANKRAVTVTAFGHGPRKRFTVEVP